jgi:hypothetical protein
MLGLLLGLAPAAHAQTEVEQRARYERGQAEQRAFEHRLISQAGFPPIAEAQAAGRVVRRVVLSDPYGMIPMPGIELEQLPDGRVTLRLQYRGSSSVALNPSWVSDPIAVEPSAWEELSALEQPLFTRPPFRPVDPASLPPPPSQPPPICHAWSARFEADRERTASWSGCGGTDHPGYRYAARVAQLAVRGKAGCAEEGDPLSSFSRCFALTMPLDDPALQTEFAILRKEYDEAPGSERLSAARVALRAPGLTLGSEAWLAARDAVGQFREVHELRRQRLNRLVLLSGSATNASAADRAKLQFTLASWSQFVQSQEANYAELLQGLAWPAGEVASGH